LFLLLVITVLLLLLLLTRGATALQETPDSEHLMACDPYGCRVVQKALEVTSTDRAVERLLQNKALTRSLFGDDAQIVRYMQDKNANHVIQCAVRMLTDVEVLEIIKPLHGKAVELATQQYACRVLQCFFATLDLQVTLPLIKEVVCEAQELTSHPYANLKFIVRDPVSHVIFL